MGMGYVLAVWGAGVMREWWTEMIGAVQVNIWLAGFSLSSLPLFLRMSVYRFWRGYKERMKRVTIMMNAVNKQVYAPEREGVNVEEKRDPSCAGRGALALWYS